ncbi:MAG: efflux RND transporter periplasmic adaptor subunit [Pseudomonadales bacterium]|nr:efflux RND transporter periplasmic adaptor subunit [Pseudomonadales bacterium]MCP5358485.1 efflux RND transporter periplasmic adaptor subunit [Pseudomonadales bacterium]
MTHRTLCILLALLLGACTDPATVTPVASVEEPHAHEHEEEHEAVAIAPAVAAELDIGTQIAGPASIEMRRTVYGRVLANTDLGRQISARFEGRIDRVYVNQGDRVEAGQRLATVESNQSLTPYDITAPISGIVLQREAAPGEQTAGRVLFTLQDYSSVWVDLALFPLDLAAAQTGTAVRITSPSGGEPVEGTIERLLPMTDVNQSRIARVTLPNPQERFTPGAWINAELLTGTVEVPLAVHPDAVQTVEGNTVVFVQEGSDYHARPVQLGLESPDWVQVLNGLSAGERYVSRNSYILKADAGKAGAEHQH